MKTWIKSILSLLILLTGTYSVQAQVKIGNNPTTINDGSVLELESTNMGLLMPRVSLTNTSTWGLLGTAAAGMHVYNTNTGITSTTATCPTLDAKIGEYYWDGSCWVALGPGNSGTQDAPVLFSVKKVSANQTIGTTATLGNLTTKAFDKTNSFNLTTDTFTVPSNGAGYYQINGFMKSLQTTGTQSVYMYIFINGVQDRVLAAGNAPAGSGIFGNGTVAMKLNAGDVIDFRLFRTLGTVTITELEIDAFLISK